MNSHDTHRPAEPLSPEERALGERLARLGPHGEPSPALDARILAAAHAAASAPVQKHRPSRRWPMALGIAASLTLAVGIAWQLRPLQEATVYDEAASATAVQAETTTAPRESAADVAADQAGAAAVQAAPTAQEGPARPPVAGARRESDEAVPSPRSAAQRARAPAPPPPAPPEPEVVFDDAAAVEAAIPAPAAPPPPAAMRAPSPAPAAKAISGETRNQVAERNSAEAAASSAAGTAATRAATQSREDAFAEDVPPATADSPEVREAWLQRIRELAMAGHTDDARASLHEFVHRYPNHPLPDDLRALLE